jgi:hypothetical protein
MSTLLLTYAQLVSSNLNLKQNNRKGIFRINEITALGKSLGLAQSDITELVKNNFTCKVSQMNTDEFAQLKSLMLTISTRQPQVNSH